MNKQLMILMFALMLIPISVFAVISTVTLNQPTNNVYNFSNSTADIVLNATIVWTDPTNVSNVTFIFTNGATVFRFTNSTTNGSRTSVTTGDFTFNISSSALTEGVYTVVAEARNMTDTAITGNALNSSSVSFGIDRTYPIISLSRPQDRTSQSPNSGVIIFEYTPTELNLGNCTISVSAGGGGRSTTSGTTSPNITSGAVNTFKLPYASDVKDIIWAVSCRDLAGLVGNSSSRTLSVLSSGYSNIVGSGGDLTTSANAEYLVESGKTLSVGSSANTGMPPKKESTFLGQYGWIFLLVLAVFVLYLIFKWKPKQ